MDLSLLKKHLLSLDKKKIVTTPELFAWYKSHKKTPLPPPPPKAPPPSPPPAVQKQAFKLNPKKENTSIDPKSLLNQLKNSVEGVTFFEEPLIPQKREVILVCKDEEKPLLEKLMQAIDQKLFPCRFGSEGELTIVSSSIGEKGIYTLPPIKDLEDLAVKQKVWKELKACLSKYS